MLVLFDIDGTLYLGDGSGSAAFLDAGREMFGDSFTTDGVAFAGALDPIILDRLARRNSIPIVGEVAREFRRRCHDALLRRLAAGRHRVRALPGGPELVRRLQNLDGIAIGLLTGNWEENGWHKLRFVGYEPDWFTVHVWGDDGPTRNDLPLIARGRYQHRHGRDIEFERILIIGDTVHDVNCALAHGCRCLAVNTGGELEVDALRAAGPDLVVPDLADTDRLVDWITQLTD